MEDADESVTIADIVAGYIRRIAVGIFEKEVGSRMRGGGCCPIIVVGGGCISDTHNSLKFCVCLAWGFYPSVRLRWVS